MKKHKKFGDSDFLPTFALANENHAEIAQLVERNLAKVEVAGPSPVFRSNNKGRTDSVLPLLLMQTCPGLVRATSRRPFQGPGVSTTDRGRHSRIARVRVPFSAPERQEWQKKGESQDSPFCFSGGDGIRRPRPQGAPFRGRGCQQRIAAITCAQRECESRFPLQKKREESCDSSLFVLSAWYRGLCRFRVSDADSGKV